MTPQRQAALEALFAAVKKMAAEGRYVTPAVERAITRLRVLAAEPETGAQP